MTPDPKPKANAGWRKQSARDGVSLGDGSQASTRFNATCFVTLGRPGPLSMGPLKRPERRAPLALSAWFVALQSDDNLGTITGEN
jgi:hypothetical protein